MKSFSLLFIAICFFVYRGHSQCTDASVFIIENNSTAQSIDNWYLETDCHYDADNNCGPDYYYLTEIGFTNYVDVVIVFPYSSSPAGYLDYYSDASGTLTVIHTQQVTPNKHGYYYTFQIGSLKPGYLKVVFRDF